MLNLWNYASFYFIAQIPVMRDFNGNLEQQRSYVFGLSKSFQLLGGSQDQKVDDRRVLAEVDRE